MLKTGQYLNNIKLGNDKDKHETTMKKDFDQKQEKIKREASLLCKKNLDIGRNQQFSIRQHSVAGQVQIQNPEQPIELIVPNRHSSAQKSNVKMGSTNYSTFKVDPKTDFKSSKANPQSRFSKERFLSTGFSSTIKNGGNDSK